MSQIYAINTLQTEYTIPNTPVSSTAGLKSRSPITPNPLHRNVTNNQQNTPKSSHSPMGGRTKNYSQVAQHENEDEDTDGDVTDVENQTSNRYLNKLNKTLPDTEGRMLLMSYLVIAICIVICLIVKFVHNDNTTIRGFMMLTVIILILIVSGIGAYALVKYGRIQDEVNRLKQENAEYEQQIDGLRNTSHKLQNEVNDLNETNNKLTAHSLDLEERTKEFDPLIKELKEIAATDADVLSVCDSMNGSFKRMSDLVNKNKRAHLLGIYYEMAFKDNDNRMNHNEYKKFLMRLDQKMRYKFQNYVRFEQMSDNDNMFDKMTFIDIVDHILNDSKEHYQEEFMKQYSYHKSISMNLHPDQLQSLREELKNA